MLDPDPLYVELPTCAAPSHGRTVTSRGHRHVVVGLTLMGLLLATLVLLKRGAPIDAVPMRSD